MTEDDALTLKVEELTLPRDHQGCLPLCWRLLNWKLSSFTPDYSECEGERTTSKRSLAHLEGQKHWERSIQLQLRDFYLIKSPFQTVIAFILLLK